MQIFVSNSILLPSRFILWWLIEEMPLKILSDLNGTQHNGFEGDPFTVTKTSNINKNSPREPGSLTSLKLLVLLVIVFQIIVSSPVTHPINYLLCTIKV